MFTFNIYQQDQDKIMASLTALKDQIAQLKAQADSNGQILQGMPALITAESVEYASKVAELQAVIDQLNASGGTLEQTEIDQITADLEAVKASVSASGEGLAAIASSISEIVPSIPVATDPVSPVVVDPVTPVDPAPEPIDPNQI